MLYGKLYKLRDDLATMANVIVFSLGLLLLGVLFFVLKHENSAYICLGLSALMQVMGLLLVYGIKRNHPMPYE